MGRKLYCLKIGGSVITDKAIPYKANYDAIREIAKVLKTIKSPLLISHGVGSFAHTSAKQYGGKNGYSDKWGIAKVALDAQKINQIVMNIFHDEGLPVVSFSPRSLILTKKGRVKKTFFDPMQEALAQGLIPVLYGDVIWDVAQKTTIYSGEKILNLVNRYLLKQHFEIAKIIQLCNVDGVFDQHKKIVSVITKQNWPEVHAYIEKMSVADVTGGMEHKVEDALEMTKYGIETWLMNGNAVNSVVDYIGGKQVKGTVIR